MEAFEFLKEYHRMCHSYEFCGNCPLWGEPCIVAGIRSLTDSEFLKVTSTVEQWSKVHPIITNSKKFEEVFGIFGHRLIHPGAQWWDELYKEPEVGQ